MVVLVWPSQILVSDDFFLSLRHLPKVGCIITDQWFVLVIKARISFPY